MSNKRPTMKKKIRRKDGVEQRYDVGVGPVSSRTDRQASRGPVPESKPKVDVDELRDAVAFDNYDAVDKIRAFERGNDYVNKSVEVHGGSQPKVILTREVYIGAGHPERMDGNDWQNGEAEGLAQDAFNRGDREVDSDDAAKVVRDSWDDIEESAEPAYQDDEFENFRKQVEGVAAENGIDLDGMEFEEVQTVTVEDKRPDLEEAAQDQLDALWAEADEVAAGNRGNYGFDKKTGLALDGYDDEGYSRGVSVERSYDRFGYNRAGYNREGYNRDGVNQRGFDLHGVHAETSTKYDRDGYNNLGYDAGGWDSEGQYKPFSGGSGAYDSAGYNSGGLDLNGFDRQGIHWRTKTTRDGYGLDQDGYGAGGRQGQRVSDVEGAPGFGGVNARLAE